MVLNRYDYLQSREGQINRHLWRKRRGRFYFDLDLEPKSKNAMSRNDKAALQMAVLEKMKTAKKRSYRSKIAMELSLKTSSINPPQVHTVVKNLLDLFSIPMCEICSKRQRLLYCDDSQIAYLAVRHFRKSEKGSIFLKTAPFADFLADLELVHFQDIEDEDEDDLSRNRLNSANVDNYYELRKKRSDIIRLFGQKAYDGLVRANKMSLQRHILSLPRLRLSDIASLYKSSRDKRLLDPKSKGLKSDFVGTIYHQISDLIYDHPIRLKLPHVPLRSGDTRNFKISVRRALREHKNRFRVLGHLMIPSLLEVLYQPPSSHKGFVKDLDNIVRIVIPIVYEELKPPLEIEGYEIIELPRVSETPKDGFVVIGVTSAWDSIESLWNRIDRAIEKWS